MQPETDDHQPFLGFRDDPTKRESSEDENVEGGNTTLLHERHRMKASRTRRFLRDFLVFLVTSLLWALALSIVVPDGSSTTTAKGGANPPLPSTGMTTVAAGEGGKAASSGPGLFTAQTHNVTSNSKLVWCGNSTQEAKKNGCKYDTLLNHWVPARCLDEEFEAEYKDDDSWYAYSDKNLTKRLSLEAMGETESYYTSIADHVNHCAVLWKKQYWVMFEDRPVFDAVIVNPYHTEHCADFLKNAYGMNRTEPTLVKVGFSGCWIRNGVDEL